ASDKDLDPADDIAPPGPAVSRCGDLWILRNHWLLCANALDADSYKALLLGETAHIVFADPPFNVPIAGNVSGLGRITHREFAMASGEMSSSEFIAFLTALMVLLVAHSRKGSL